MNWTRWKERRINKKRSYWNKLKGTIKFLRWNFINNYNFTMGHADIADQLRGNYQIDRWVKSINWWQSMMSWVIGTLLNNSCVVYLKTICHMELKRNIYCHTTISVKILRYLDPPWFLEGGYESIKRATIQWFFYKMKER